MLNLRSLFWGVGASHYPVAWWNPPLKRFLVRYSLQDVVPETKFERWVMQGRAAFPTPPMAGQHSDASVQTRR